MDESGKASEQSSIRDPNVLVRGSGAGFSQEIIAGSHRLTADEPVAAGGTDIGPTPYDLLLAALGACTSMTVGMYARRKKWPLAGVVVRQFALREVITELSNGQDTGVRWSAIGVEFGDQPHYGAPRSIFIRVLLDCADNCLVVKTLDVKPGFDQRNWQTSGPSLRLFRCIHPRCILASCAAVAA
jgi:hypothetical protein